MSISDSLKELKVKIEAEFHDNPLSRLLGELHAEVEKIEVRIALIEVKLGLTVAKASNEPGTGISIAVADAGMASGVTAPTAAQSATSSE